MNSIANWAKQRAVAARLLIAFLHVFVYFSAIYFSLLSTDAGIFFSLNQAILVAVTGFSIIGIAGWYRKKIVNFVARHCIKIFRYLLMGFCCTGLIIGAHNDLSIPQQTGNGYVQAAFTGAEKKEKPNYDSYENKQDFYKDLKAYYKTLTKKELKKEFKHQLKELSNASTSVGRILIALIIILLVSIALFLIAGLACGLACNGQGALALLVLVGGTAGVILLTVLLVNALKKQEKKKSTEEKAAKEKKPDEKIPEGNE